MYLHGTFPFSCNIQLSGPDFPFSINQDSGYPEHGEARRRLQAALLSACQREGGGDLGAELCKAHFFK